MLANEYAMEKHTEENPFCFTWEQENRLVITNDNYKALCDSLLFLNTAINNIASMDGIDNIKEYLVKASNEMVNTKSIFDIYLDMQRRRSA